MHTWRVGAIRAIFDGTEVKDYDIYFRNPIEFNTFIQDISTMRHSVLQAEGNFEQMKTFRVKGLRIQVIGFRNSDTIQDLLATFDFTATRFGYDGKHIYFDRYAYQDAVGKKLKIFKVQNPLPMIKRALKYANKGYFVPDDTMTRLFEALEEKHPEIVVENDYEGAQF